MMFASTTSRRAFVFSGRSSKNLLLVHAPINSRPRCFSASSSTTDLVLTNIDTDSGVATLTMNSSPVNSLSLEMCQAISSAIKQVEEADSSSSSNKKIQSLVLASSLPSIFCAGLDIMEMHKPNEQRLKEFWNSFQQLYLDLYGSNLATIAAIAGHAPAAGCMLALSCDYRIMMTTTTTTTTTTTAGSGDDAGGGGAAATKKKPPPTIGLNETKLGIVAPPWLGQQFIDTVGQRQAELGLSLGLLYSPEEAKAIGLVDELVVGTTHDVLIRAQEEARKWGEIPPKARLGSKMLARKKRLDHLIANRQEDNDFFRSFVTDDRVQQTIDSYLQSLASKKKK